MSLRLRIRRARIRRRRALKSARRWLKRIRTLRRKVTGISDEGVKLITKYEGFSPTPYKDAVGVWTIGYGSTKDVGPKSPMVTRAQAEDRLRAEVNATYFPAVQSLPTFKYLKQNQVDALVSAVYNLGPGAIGPDTGLGKALRRKDWKAAGSELMRWDKAGGKQLLGLTRRRREERALFLRG